MTLRKIFEPNLLNDGYPAEWVVAGYSEHRYAELQEIMDRMYHGGPAATKVEIEEWEALQ